MNAQLSGHRLGSAPPRRGSPGPLGPEPRKGPKRVPKESREAGPPESQTSAPRSLKRVRKASESQGLNSSLTLQPLLFWKKARETPKKKQRFFSSQNPQNPWKRKEKHTHTKRKQGGRSENRKKQGKRKKQGPSTQRIFSGYFLIFNLARLIINLARLK